MADSSNPPATAAPRSPRLRVAIELAVCLVILVTLFRTYLAGGYMIETGSMAPCLLGRHRPVVCPSCRYPFAVEGTGATSTAVCPNCGEAGISVEGCPDNDGDHLLVHRGMYAFRSPRRWEVIVFQNPNKPRQAYVKRLIGLPGESVQIRGGDVYIAGEIQTKDYATQCGLRIPVYDHDFRPPDDAEDWRPRWKPERDNGNWHADGGKFRFKPRGKSAVERLEWVNYRHWIRSGGSRVTSVPLAEWPGQLDQLTRGFGPLRYDKEARKLFCEGALSVAYRDRLLAALDGDKSRKQIERLFDESHTAPIVDNYGYNWGLDGQGKHEVRDLMLSLEVHLHEGPGVFVVAIADGSAEFQCVFDRDAGEVKLLETRGERVLRSTRLEPARNSKPVRVEVSLMDRQVLLALDGKLAFEPCRYAATASRGPTPAVPVRFGANGAAVEVATLRLFRDVYYSDTVGRRGIDRPVHLRANEYFVLGDNSPVSQDSRSWTNQTVLTHDLLLGKPLFVHLPSRKKKVRIGEFETEIRIPELSRMRYIH